MKIKGRSDQILRMDRPREAQLAVASPQSENRLLWVFLQHSRRFRLHSTQHLARLRVAVWEKAPTTHRGACTAAHTRVRMQRHSAGPSKTVLGAETVCSFTHLLFRFNVRPVFNVYG